MSSQTSDDEVYEVAKKRVKAKRDFYGNLGAWAIVNIILIIVWALTNLGGHPWFLWCLCIWGIFVLLHYLRVFVFERKSDRTAIEKEAERIKKEQG